MNTWDLVQDLFDETASLPAPQRARVLAERLGPRTEIIRQIEDLVRADAHEHSPLDGTAIALFTGGVVDDVHALVGAHVGAYRVEAFLSSGGMAHVYRAVRKGVERRVALKVLKRGLDTDALVARFRREQRTLAALDHPNVVAFHEAGALADGRPYLIMEYVEGAPITSWCDEQRLPLRARIELFVDVLAAVQHAHGKLLVHRDLKPSNVLVTAGGVPKLLDFGIVALLEDEGGVAAATRVGGGPSPLTAGYASPEQLRGEPVTTASDVYSLGALLYELLAGVRALPSPGSAGQGAAESANAPPPPSTRAVDATRARGLRGDLDIIVATAMNADPSRRYASVQSLADDLRRHLQGHPIAARRDALVHRLAKFIGRNRWPVALGCALLLVLAAGWAGAELGRRRALDDASRGWGAHNEAKQVARFLEDLVVDASSTSGGWQAAVAAREEGLTARFPDDPEAEGLVRLALGRFWVEHACPERARPHLERVLVLLEGDNALGAADEQRARDLLARMR